MHFVTFAGWTVLCRMIWLHFTQNVIFWSPFGLKKTITCVQFNSLQCNAEEPSSWSTWMYQPEWAPENKTSARMTGERFSVSGPVLEAPVWGCMMSVKSLRYAFTIRTSKWPQVQNNKKLGLTHVSQSLLLCKGQGQRQKKPCFTEKEMMWRNEKEFNRRTTESNLSEFYSQKVQVLQYSCSCWKNGKTFFLKNLWESFVKQTSSSASWSFCFLCTSLGLNMQLREERKDLPQCQADADQRDVNFLWGFVHEECGDAVATYMLSFKSAREQKSQLMRWSLQETLWAMVQTGNLKLTPTSFREYNPPSDGKRSPFVCATFEYSEWVWYPTGLFSEVAAWVRFALGPTTFAHVVNWIPFFDCEALRQCLRSWFCSWRMERQCRAEAFTVK